MKPARTALLAFATLFAGSAVMGCSAGGTDDGGQVGNAGLDLTLIGGGVLNAIGYTVSGPAGFSNTGSINVANSSTLQALIPLPAGGPYSIALNGTTTDGTTTCTGAGTFSVMARATVPVAIHLTCREAARVGSVLVNGTINVCPQIDGIWTNPNEVIVGLPLAITSVGHDTDSGPAPLSYAWTASGGVLATPSAQNTSFTCTAIGPVTVTLTLSDGDADPACAARQTVTVNCSKPTATLALFGDWPYGNVIATAPSFIAQVNADPDVELALHIGDIHSGSQACSDAYNLSIFNYFQMFQDPLVYTPGDNEWTDCQKVKEFSSGAPLAELAKLRTLFFPNPGRTLGAAPKSVLSQANGYDAAHSEDAAYAENVIWEQANVLFVTLNFPGSNNDTLPWAAPFSNPTAQAEEVLLRSAANSRWLAKAFAIAKAHHVAGVLIGQQADMWDLAQVVPGGDGLGAYDEHVLQLATLARDFGKPVLLVNGDSHLYGSDQPLLDPASATGVIHHVPFSVPNLTRITVDGSTNFKDWVKLSVDPATPAVFSWTRINTPL